MPRRAFRYGTRMLITGASSGIGLACAEFFAALGYEVFAVSRGMKEESRELGGGKIYGLKMDVTDYKSVESAMTKIGPVDIVLHCAGYGIAGSAEETSAQEALEQMDVNLLGVIRVNSFVLPSMRERGRGLVLAVSSVAAQVSVPFQAHYSASKAALEAVMEALRSEIAPFGVKVCIIEPGDTSTGFTSARKTSFPQGSPYAETGKKSVSKMERDEKNGKPPVSCAKCALRMIKRRNPPVRRAVGAQYRLLLFAKRLLPDSLIRFIVKKMYA